MLWRVGVVGCSNHCNVLTQFCHLELPRAGQVITTISLLLSYQLMSARHAPFSCIHMMISKAPYMQELNEERIKWGFSVSNLLARWPRWTAEISARIWRAWQWTRPARPHLLSAPRGTTGIIFNRNLACASRNRVRKTTSIFSVGQAAGRGGRWGGCRGQKDDDLWAHKGVNTVCLHGTPLTDGVLRSLLGHVRKYNLFILFTLRGLI